MKRTDHVLGDTDGFKAETTPDPDAARPGGWGRYLRTERLGDVVLVTMDDPSGRANKTTELFKEELDALLSALEAVPAPAGLLIRSAKSSFGVGGDIGQVTGFAGQGEAASFADSERIKALFLRLERLPFPSVALLEGTAAGGGWELALACDMRLCVDVDTIRLGLPEVTFGLVPGAGGMVRLPHMVGLERAGALIAGARMQTPAEAAADGLVDALVPDRAELLQAGINSLMEQKRRLFPAAKNAAGFTGPVAGAPGSAAPRKALDALARIAGVPFEEASAIESRCFAECATSHEAQALIGLGFFDRNLLRRSGATLHPAIERIGHLLAAALEAERLAIRQEGIPDGMLAHAAAAQGYELSNSLQDADASHDGADVSGFGERLVFAQAVAALRVLAEDESLPAVAFNVGSVEKGGFPRRSGGVLRFVAHMGAEAFVSRAGALAYRHGDAFAQPFEAEGLARRLRAAELADRKMGNSG